METQTQRTDFADIVGEGEGITDMNTLLRVIASLGELP